MTALLLLLLSLPAHATEYVRFDSLKKEQRELWQLHSKAVIPLQMASGMRCSAVYVGPNGEALTNLHCLEACLIENNSFDEEKIPGSEVSLYHPRPGITCPLRYGHRPKRAKAEVLHIFGPGWIHPRNKLPDFIKNNRELALRLTHEGYEGPGDLALIKLPETSACVKLGDRLDGTLTNIAFPLLARRGSSNPTNPIFFTMGNIQLWSQGTATLDADFLREKRPHFEDMMPFILAPGTLISSVDTEGGSSGSPLFDEEGGIVALIRATWKGDANIYIPWTSHAVNLLVYKDRIQQQVPENTACATR